MSDIDANQPVLSYHAPPGFEDAAGEGEVVIRAQGPSAQAGIVWLSLGLAGVVIVAAVLLLMVGMAWRYTGIDIGGIYFVMAVLIGVGAAGWALILGIRRRMRYGQLPVTFRVDREGRLTIFNPRNWGMSGRTWDADEVQQITVGPIRRALSGGRWFELRLLMITFDQVGISVAAEDEAHPRRLVEALVGAMRSTRCPRPQCGAENPRGARFCRRCGRMLMLS